MPEETCEEHPSYAAIRLTRVSGGDGKLFMSPLRHSHRVALTISRASLHRDHSWDRHHSGLQHIVEVEMSEEQFARMITSSGDGNGTPCTLRFVKGEGLIPTPPMQLKSERYYDEARAKAAEVVKTLDALQSKVTELSAKLPKKTQEELRSVVAAAQRQVADHLPWVVQMLHEHMDKVVNQAKVEVEAYINQRMTGSGMLLRGEVPVLSLPALGPAEGEEQ